MESNSTEPVSGRVPVDLATRIEDAADEAGVTKSQLVGRAVEYYADENPDAIPALHPEGSLAAFVEELV